MQSQIPDMILGSIRTPGLTQRNKNRLRIAHYTLLLNLKSFFILLLRSWGVQVDGLWTCKLFQTHYYNLLNTIILFHRLCHTILHSYTLHTIILTIILFYTSIPSHTIILFPTHYRIQYHTHLELYCTISCYHTVFHTLSYSYTLLHFHTISQSLS